MNFWTRRNARAKQENAAPQDETKQTKTEQLAAAARRGEKLEKYLRRKEATREAERRDKLLKLFPRRMDSAVSVSGQKVFAMDAAPLPGRGNAVGIDPAIIDTVADYFIGYQACAILKQNWLIDRACTISAVDAMAPGYRLGFADETDDQDIPNVEERKINEKRLADIEEISRKKYRIPEICIKANIVKKVFGYSLIVPVFRDEVDYSVPFNIDGIKPGSYVGLKVIEPMWILPQFGSDAANPLSENFYDPEYYALPQGNGRLIHRSWCIKLINSEVPDILKPVYYWGGIPLTQQIYRRVYAAEKTADEAPMLALSKRLLVVSANLDNYYANPDEVEKKMEALTELRNNFGVFIRDIADNGDVQQIDTSLADFEETTILQYQLVSAIAQIPINKLLKIPIKGFQSVGTYETDDYNQSLLAIQKDDFTPIIQLHNSLYSKSELGEEIAFVVHFNEIDTPTEKETAEIREINSRTAANYVAAQILAPEEERDRLRRDEDSGYSTIKPDYDYEDEDADLIQEGFEDAEKAAAEEEKENGDK